MIIDLHVHTVQNSKCSKVDLKKAIIQAQKIGLSGVCITDHENDPIEEKAKDLAREMDFLVIPGMEILTKEGDFLVFGLSRRPEKLLSAQELMDRVTRKNGIAIGAHPFRKNGRSAGNHLKKLTNLSAVEAFNGNTPEDLNLQALEMAEKMSLPSVGGSDAHDLSQIGCYATYFSRQINNVYDLICAVKYGEGEPVYFKDGSFYPLQTKIQGGKK